MCTLALGAHQFIDLISASVDTETADWYQCIDK